MPAELLDGKNLAAAMRADIAAQAPALKAARGITPGLAVILTGNDNQPTLFT